MWDSDDERPWDVFISYAHEDREPFVISLVRALRRTGLSVWYDEFHLRVGQSIRQALDAGIRGSRFGIVVLSPNYFKKLWTSRELDGLLSMEEPDSKVILPIWHNVTSSEVRDFSPMLAGRYALNSNDGAVSIVSTLRETIHPDVTMRISSYDGHTVVMVNPEDGTVLIQNTPSSGDGSLTKSFGEIEFAVQECADMESLVKKLHRRSDPVSEFVASQFSEDTLQLLARFHASVPVPASLQSAIVAEFNNVLSSGESVYEPERFAGVFLSEDVRSFFDYDELIPDEIMFLNRRLIEAAYPHEIARGEMFNMGGMQMFDFAGKQVDFGAEFSRFNDGEAKEVQMFEYNERISLVEINEAICSEADVHNGLVLAAPISEDEELPFVPIFVTTCYTLGLINRRIFEATHR